MGRNEIRLRRNMMSSGRIAQHRNYSELMRLHSRENTIRRILRVFLYFLIILFLLIILITVLRWEKKQETSRHIEVKTFTAHCSFSLESDVG